MLRDTAGGAGSRGGRGRVCSSPPLGELYLRCQDDGPSGRGPSGDNGDSGSPGTSKIKITHNSTMGVNKLVFATRSVRWLNGQH